MTDIGLYMKKAARGLLLKVPYVKTELKRYEHLKRLISDSGFEPGHYYSTIPDLNEIRDSADSIFSEKEVRGIELNMDRQLMLLEEFKGFYHEYPYHSEASEPREYRYRKAGALYRYSDSVFLYCMLRKFKPRRIIEVGSGHSSAIMLDVNEIYGNGTHHTFIDPDTERLDRILRPGDRASNNVIKGKVQDVDMGLFQTLERDDVLFIDSTHVSKVASDVNHIYFNILPSLKPGVLIHIHDIFSGFEYPRRWILNRRWFWNENYLLRAFLMYNRDFEIVLFNSDLQRKMPDWFGREMPECLIRQDDSGCIWLRKTGD
jgi:predicted O-methyltransferase YrrM